MSSAWGPIGNEFRILKLNQLLVKGTMKMFIAGPVSRNLESVRFLFFPVRFWSGRFGSMTVRFLSSPVRFLDGSVSARSVRFQ